MILIFFLCFKLSILHLCVSDLGYECNNDALLSDDATKNNTIYLISDFNTLNYKLNEEFKSACSIFYNIVEVNYTDGENLSDTFHVIYFAVPDYDDTKPLNNFVYAGHITTTEVECNETKEIVNIVSQSIEDLNDQIYAFVHKMTDNNGFIQKDERERCKRIFENTAELTTVILCADEHIAYNYIQLTSPLKLKILPKDLCSNQYLNYFDDQLLTVLAPKPFEVTDTAFSVPTIFYETPYMASEYKDVFPNSMNLIPWRLLKYGFLKFIQTVGWQRVVIVTDDSEFGLDFEGELTALFNKEGMVYTVVRCEDAKCNMEKIKEELLKIEARIVIANVDDKHAQYLFHNVDKKITWLAKELAEHTHITQNVFSISLRAVKNKDCQVEDNILTGLSSIATVYKNLQEKEIYKAKRVEFYRRFAKKIKNYKEVTEAEVIVKKYNDVVSRMYVDSSGAEVTHFKNPYGSAKPYDGMAPCLATSYDYFNTCQDQLSLLLMFVVLLFFTTFLLITCYFDKTAPVNDIRYLNFR